MTTEPSIKSLGTLRFDSKNPVAQRLLQVCNGHPAAAIVWPHRLLHEGAEQIATLEVELERLRAGAVEATQPSGNPGELDALRAECDALKERLGHDFMEEFNDRLEAEAESRRQQERVMELVAQLTTETAKREEAEKELGTGLDQAWARVKRTMLRCSNNEIQNAHDALYGVGEWSPK